MGKGCSWIGLSLLWVELGPKVFVLGQGSDFYLVPFTSWAGPGSNGRKLKPGLPDYNFFFFFSIGSVGDWIQSQYISDVHVCHNH